MDDKPLANATVMFHPKSAEGYHGAMATTDESGKYSLETDTGNGKTKKGVVPGSYDVTVTKLMKADGTTVKFDPESGPMSQGATQVIPLRWATVNDLGLSSIVPEGGGTFDIKISGEGGSGPG